jgi:hypothetical protein
MNQQAAKEAWEKEDATWVVEHGPYISKQSRESYQASLKKMVEEEMIDLDKERRMWLAAKDKTLAHNCAIRITTLQGVLEMITTAMPPSK